MEYLGNPYRLVNLGNLEIKIRQKISTLKKENSEILCINGCTHFLKP